MNKMHLYKEYVDEFTEAGLSVIPDKFMMKTPAIKSWSDYCKRKPTQEEIDSWKESFDSSNISVCLGEASGIVALDMDATDPEIAELITKFAPKSPVEKVGSKGWTRFFRWHPTLNTDILKYNGEVMVELLSNGKKTTIPPSVHPNGETYKWTDKSLTDVSIQELPALPPSVLPFLGQKIRELKGGEAPSYNKIINGRNDALTKFTSELINDKIPLGEAVKKLIKFDEDNHETPLFTDTSEFRHTEAFTNALTLYTNCLNSFNGKRYQANKEYETPIIPETVEVTPGKQKSECQKSYDNPELPKPEGVLAVIMNYILVNSYIEQPAFAFSAALSILATLSGRKFEFEGVAPNLYILNVAPSGSGKNAPQEKLKDILIDIKCEHLLGAGDYVSDASLMDSLPESPVRLDIVDEAGGMLKSVNRGGATYNGKMADILAELYTSSTSIFLGRQTAMGHKGRSIRPNVNLLCSTTPTGLAEGVSVTAIEKGLMGRFLVFQGFYNKKARRVENVTRLGKDAVNSLITLAGYQPKKGTVEIAGISQDITVIEKTDAANKMLQQVFEEFDTLRVESEHDDKLLPIISRLYQQTLKITMLHAISRNIYKEPIVDVRDVEFGYLTIKYYFHTIKEVIKQSIFSSTTEENTQKVLNAINRNNEEGITKRQLRNRTRFLNKKQRDLIMEELIESGEVELVSVNVDGRISYRYRGKNA